MIWKRALLETHGMGLGRASVLVFRVWGFCLVFLSLVFLCYCWFVWLSGLVFVSFLLFCCFLLLFVVFWGEGSF